MQKFFEKIVESKKTETSGDVIFFRIFELFVLYYIVKFAWEWGLYTMRLGDVALPLGLANYIDIRFMYGNILPLANAVLITLFGIIAFFKKFRGTYGMIIILLHIQLVARDSQGEISHSGNMIGMTLMGLALGNLFFSNPSDKRKFVWSFVFFYIGLSYVSAGICKLVGSGWTWAAGQHLWLWMAEKGTDTLSRTGSFEMNALQQLASTHVTIATLILTIGLVTELSGFLLWFSNTRPYITIALIGLHIGIMFTMNIQFHYFIHELILIGFPWSRLIDYLLVRKPSWFESRWLQPIL
ncbi:hypothetical protein K1X84_08460 [bacterium]|nr:hypothetical protein [bacterium]